MAKRIASLFFGLALMVGCGVSKSPMAPVASSEVAEPARKLVISQEKAGGGATVPFGGASIVRDRAMSDRSKLNPTGVLASQDVLIGSFRVRLPKGATLQAVGLSSQIGLKSDFALGDVFNNLRLRDGLTGTQIGVTIGTLVVGGQINSSPWPTQSDYGLGGSQFDLGEPFYVFQPATGLLVGDFIVEISADVKSSPTPGAVEVLNALQNGAVIPIVSFLDENGQTHVVWCRERMQRVYIAEHGDLRISLSSDNYAPAFLRAGGEYVVKYRLTADATEDVSVSPFTPVLYTPDEAAGYVEEVRLYESHANLLGTYYPISSPSGLTVRNEFMPFYLETGSSVIAANTSKDLYLWYRVSRDCPVGTNITIALYPEVSGRKLIEARGMTSGQNLPLDNIFSPSGQPSLWVTGRVVAAVDEGQLFGTIPVKDYSITQSAEIEGFLQTVSNGVWKIDVEFAPGVLPAGTSSVRLVFSSADAGLVTMVSSDIAGNTVHFQKPWVGHQEEVSLTSEGSEYGQYYGDLAFFAR